MSYSLSFDFIFILTKWHSGRILSSGILEPSDHTASSCPKWGGSKKGHEFVFCLWNFFFFSFLLKTWKIWWKFGHLTSVLLELTILKLHKHIILKTSGEAYHIHIHSTGSLLFGLVHLFSDFLWKVRLGVLPDCSGNNILAPPQSPLRGETAHDLHRTLHTFPASLLLIG